MKRITVRIAGSTREAQAITIQEGTTAGDVLRQLGLSGYLLSAKGSESYFGDDEVIYPQVSENELLFASTTADVGVI